MRFELKSSMMGGGGWDRGASFFGVDLSHVLLFGSESNDLEGMALEDMMPQLGLEHSTATSTTYTTKGTTHKRSSTRGEEEEEEEEPDEPRSNRRLALHPNEPVRLPHFGQNLLLGSDRLRIEEARATEASLSQALHALKDKLRQRDPSTTFAAAELSRLVAEARAWINSTMANSIWKPATVQVLFQLSTLVIEIALSAQLCEQEMSSPASSVAPRLVLTKDGCGLPVKQKEAILMEAVVLLPSWCGGAVPGDLRVDLIDEDGNLVSSSGLKAVSEKAAFAARRAASVTIEKGTGKSVAFLRCACTVSKVEALSCVSRPIVVTTNEKQWSDALGKILRHQLFTANNVQHLPVNTIANALQDAYLRGTRQTLTDPPRPLSPREFDFIFGKLISMPSIDNFVTEREFQVLWEWLGPIFSKLRHNKQVQELWLQGFVMGLIDKESSERILLKERPGTFLVRFSLQMAGSFAIAYTSASGDSVQHYLLKKSDMNVSRTLASFLMDKDFFQIVLQTVPTFDSEMKWARFDKSKALEKYVGEPEKNSVEGYDEKLMML